MVKFLNVAKLQRFPVIQSGFISESLKELKETGEKLSALNEIVESLSQEKMNFVIEKDEMKKKLISSQKNVENLTEKLNSTEENLERFGKDIEQNNEIVKKLKKKIENLEVESEGTKR